MVSRYVMDVNSLINDIAYCYREALRTDHVNLEEIFIKICYLVIQNKFTEQRKQIETELHGEASRSSLEKKRHVSGEVSSEDATELQQEVSADDKPNEISPPKRSGNRSQGDGSHLSDDNDATSEMFSLRLEKDRDENVEALNDIDVGTVVERDKEEGHSRRPRLSFQSFLKNEEICGLEQKLEEMEKLNKGLKQEFQSLQAENQRREKSLNEITTQLLEDLKEVSISIENNSMVSEIENCKDGTVEEKLGKMQLCLSKINDKIRKLNQGVSLDHSNTNVDRQDDENCTRPLRSPSMGSNTEDNSSCPRNEASRKREIGDKVEDVVCSSETENSKMNPLSNKKRKRSTQVQEEEFCGCAPFPLEAHLVKTSRLRKRICDIQTNNIPNNNSIDQRGRNVKPFVENKSPTKAGRTKRQKNKSASTLKKRRIASDNNNSSSTKGYSCMICHQRFKSIKYFQSHNILQHKDLSPYKCTHCPKSFKGLNNLKHHIRGVHDSTRPFQCNQCSWSFKFKSKLNYHIRFVHNPIKPFPCVQCRSSFKHKGGLNRHIRQVHNPKKSFQCAQCSFSVKRKYNLMKVHIQNKHVLNKN